MSNEPQSLAGGRARLPQGVHDLLAALAGAVAGMRFTRQGQSCTASSRIYVDAELHDGFAERLAAGVSNLRRGDPLDEATDIGTVINARQRAGR